MRQAHLATAVLCATAFLTGCGLAYQAASEHRADKMNQQLKAGLSPVEVTERYGEPDIEEKIDDNTEVWSYAKHANSDDAFAQLFYTSAR